MASEGLYLGKLVSQVTRKSGFYCIYIYINIYIFLVCVMLVTNKSTTKQNNVRQHVITTDSIHVVSDIEPSAGAKKNNDVSKI